MPIGVAGVVDDDRQVDPLLLEPLQQVVQPHRQADEHRLPDHPGHALGVGQIDQLLDVQDALDVARLALVDRQPAVTGAQRHLAHLRDRPGVVDRGDPVGGDHDVADDLRLEADDAGQQHRLTRVDRALALADLHEVADVVRRHLAAAGRAGLALEASHDRAGDRGQQPQRRRHDLAEPAQHPQRRQRQPLGVDPAERLGRDLAEDQQQHGGHENREPDGPAAERPALEVTDRQRGHDRAHQRVGDVVTDQDGRQHPHRLAHPERGDPPLSPAVLDQALGLVRVEAGDRGLRTGEEHARGQAQDDDQQAQDVGIAHRRVLTTFSRPAAGLQADVRAGVNGSMYRPLPRGSTRAPRCDGASC
jgi:hypothetical protein